MSFSTVPFVILRLPSMVSFRWAWLRLLSEETQTERGLRLFLVFVVITEIHTKVGVLQHIRFS